MHYKLLKHDRMLLGGSVSFNLINLSFHLLVKVKEKKNTSYANTILVCEEWSCFICTIVWRAKQWICFSQQNVLNLFKVTKNLKPTFFSFSGTWDCQNFWSCCCDYFFRTVYDIEAEGCGERSEGRQTAKSSEKDAGNVVVFLVPLVNIYASAILFGTFVGILMCCLSICLVWVLFSALQI